VIDSPEPIDFQPLIEALQAANSGKTFNEQLAQIELALVSSEMNPKPNTFCDLLWAVEAIGSIDITARRWQPVEEPLESFFSPNN
jgi:hypothetical protein